MKAGSYKDHEIVLNDRHYFDVTGPTFDPDDRHYGFPRYQDACEEIDNRLKKASKQAAINMALPVVKHDGSGLTEIKGVHQKLGTLLFTDGDYSRKAAERYGGPNVVYPPQDWIQELLREREGLEKRIGEINKTVRPYEIRVHFSNRVQGYDGYLTAISDLKTEYAHKADIAAKANYRGKSTE